MAMLSGLALLGLGLAGAAGVAIATRDGDQQTRQRTPASAEDRARGNRPRRGRPITGTAITREEFARRQAASKVGETNPPDPTKNESTAVSDARTVALRARRRAAAGNAGRVKLPGGTNAAAGGAPRMLLGY